MQVANQGGGEALVIDSVGRLMDPSYRARVAHHEAGHFLIAYLLGLLPKSYTLSAWDAFARCVNGRRPAYSYCISMFTVLNSLAVKPRSCLPFTYGNYDVR